MFLAVQCGKQMLDTQFQNSSRPFFAITPKILIWINRKISDITKPMKIGYFIAGSIS